MRQIDSVALLCHLDAIPSSNLKFMWFEVEKNTNRELEIRNPKGIEILNKIGKNGDKKRKMYSSGTNELLSEPNKGFGSKKERQNIKNRKRYNENINLKDHIGEITIETKNSTSKLTIPFYLLQKISKVKCKGINNIGTQKIPCEFDLSSLGPPGSLANCSLLDNKQKIMHEKKEKRAGASFSTVVKIACKENRLGAEAIYFHLEAFQRSTLVANISR